MSFPNGPKFKRIEVKTDGEITPEMGDVIVKAWDKVMFDLGYLTVTEPTAEERRIATALAAEDGITVTPSKRVYNDKQLIYDIVIQQIGAEIIFERGDAEESPLQ